MVKRCEHCGKEFETEKFHPRQRFCSAECYRTWYYDQNGKKIREQMRKQRRIAQILGVI